MARRWLRRGGIAVLALLALVGVLLIRGWAPEIPVEELTARWAPPPSQFIELEQLRVHYRDVGPRDDPAPLLLLHGTSASLHTWEGWVAALSPRHRVVTLDLPGFGLTGRFPDGDATVAHTLRVLTAFCEALGLERVVLVGNSYGGRLAWEFALVHPERVHRLVLVDASGYPRNSVSVPIGFRLIQLPGIRLLRDVFLPRSVVERSVKSVYGDPMKVTPELIDRYYELARRSGNRKALAERMEQVPSVGDVGRLKALQVKTLILWGAKDELIPLESGHRFDEDIPDSTLVVFDSLGHVPHEEDPESSASALESFLSVTPLPNPLPSGGEGEK
jgi:pimeloyl-ACP methyl ester carboxylesterase